MTNDIRLLQELLTLREREDLAHLLHHAKSDVISLHQYGNYWNSYLADFVIAVPPYEYECLTHLSPEDSAFLREAIAALYPPTENAPQIEKVQITLLKTAPVRPQNKALITSWRKKALTKYTAANHYFAAHNYAECISTCQEVLELLTKSLYFQVTHHHPKRHELKETEFYTLLQNLPSTFSRAAVAQLLIRNRFWLHVYSLAKYGLEDANIGADYLFTQEDASLALHHSESALTLFTLGKNDKE